MAGSLKSGHVYWLSAVALIDVGACVALTSPDFTPDEIFAWALSQRAALLFVLAPVVLLLANFLGANVKASLVFFRGRTALPGHRAFSRYVNSDSRIDTKRLRDNIGKFPRSPKAQNSTWYGIYDKYRERPEVEDSNRRFILFRDLAAISVFSVLLAPTLIFLMLDGYFAWAIPVAFFVQYLLFAIAAQVAGVRLVTTVLAIESHR